MVARPLGFERGGRAEGKQNNRQHFTKSILRSFKARHGLKAGKLSNALLSPGKKRKAGSSESEEQEQEEAQPQESPLAKKKKTRKIKMEMEDNKALK